MYLVKEGMQGCGSTRFRGKKGSARRLAPLDNEADEVTCRAVGAEFIVRTSLGIVLESAGDV